MSVGPFRKNPLQFALHVFRTYGDFAFVRLGWVRIYLLNRPELIREVLTSKMKSFRRLSRQMNELAKLEGEGVTTSEGEVWRRHRAVVHTAFTANHLERFSRIFVDFTRRRVETWQDGAWFDMTEEMNQLALELIGKVLFDADWSKQSAEIREAVHIFRTHMQKEIAAYVHWPRWLPLPGRLRQRRAIRQLDTMIWDLIHQRRTAEELGGDILSLMLAAGQAANPPLNDEAVRDDAATLFIAGHDTTSAALAWFWYLLAQHPKIEGRLLAEIDAVLAGRLPTFADVRRLKFTEMVVKESMRLYPVSAFFFGREALEDVELGGYTIPRGSWLLISPYILHHDPRYFKDPESFDPDRFQPDREDAIPPYVYVPFGGGPRTCSGNNFAMVQIILVIATVLQKFRLSLPPDQPPVEPELEVILRPKGSIRMRAVKREISQSTVCTPAQA